MPRKTTALLFAGLLGASVLGACELPGGGSPDLPDLPPQICDLLPPGTPGCQFIKN